MTASDREEFDFTHHTPDDESLSLASIFSGIRHEIGNPVNSIKIAIGVLQENFDAYSREKVMEYLERVLTDVERIEDMLRNLKSYTMYDNLSFKDFKLTEFVDNCMFQLKNDLDEKGITVRLHIQPKIGRIRTDPTALGRVFMNVLENAVDALEGIKNPVIIVDMRRLNGKIRISVTDNGHGVPGSYWGEVFKPFFSTRTHKTGLGLSIAHRILSKMNGTIFLKGGEDTGTAVVIEIPAKNKEEPNAQTQPPDHR